MPLKQLKLIWFDPSLSHVNNVSAHGFAHEVRQHLAAYGLTFTPCVNAEQVYHEATAQTDEMGVLGMRTLVVLNADFAQNCALAHYLRAVVNGVRIVLRTPDYKEQTLLNALQSGADGYFCGTVSPHFVSALLFSKVREVGALLPLCATPFPNERPTRGWRFDEQAWVLISPEGKAVQLTSGERAFLMALTHQPERRASHEMLITQLWAGPDETHKNGRERLGVIVSRLRRKFKANGLELPVRTVHGSGYMFYGVLLTS